MRSLDLKVIQQAHRWLEQGQPVWLGTVLSTFGSAPRPPGAMLAALDSGEYCGSLSGGCVEEAFIERLINGGFSRDNQVIIYGHGGLDANVALPCGGSIRLLLECLMPDLHTLEHVAGVERACAGGQMIVREVSLPGRSCSLHKIHVLPTHIEEHVASIRIRVGAVYRLLLAGRSSVAEYCASIALSMGYEVILCEPRAEVLSGFAMTGVKVIEMLPARYIAEGGCHSATAVVALTHDPRIDDPAVLESLDTTAFYIGAMGSVRTSERRLDRLKRIGGLSNESLARVHAPVGLRLGSKTPAEIAVAVMADILRVSNNVRRGSI